MMKDKHFEKIKQAVFNWDLFESKEQNDTLKYPDKKMPYWSNKDYTVAPSSFPTDYMYDSSNVSKIAIGQKAYIKVGNIKFYSKIMSFDIIKRQVTVKVYDEKLVDSIRVASRSGNFLTFPVNFVHVIRKEYVRVFKR